MALMQLSSSITFAKIAQANGRLWDAGEVAQSSDGHALLPRTSADGRKIVCKECTPSALTIGTHIRPPITSMSIT
jgi:hypothetical protein